MTTERLTTEKAIELLRGAVAKRGDDYIYPPAQDGQACTYVADGAPSCLVGHVLADLGVDLAEMAAHEGASAGEVTRNLGLTVGYSDVAKMLDAVQTVQDDAYTWGYALQVAEYEAGLREDDPRNEADEDVD